MGRREKGRRFKARNVHVPSDTFIFKRSDRVIYYAGQRPKNSAALLLVTTDNFLVHGIKVTFNPLYDIIHQTSLEDAWRFQQTVKAGKIIIDIECLASPVLDELNTLRHLTRSELPSGILFLTEHHAPHARFFLDKILLAKQINRRESIAVLRKEMLASPEKNIATSGSLNNSEWSLILLISKGLSLKEIARQSNHPYHRVMYQLKVILQKLQLSSRVALIRLIQQFSNDYPP